jgi:bacteriorhodopsin
MTRNGWLGFGAAAFALGFVAILAIGNSPRRERKEAEEPVPRTREEENDTLIHSLVVLTAGTAYLAMASGRGRIQKEDGHELFVARYIDWAITTPMLLTGLALTALGSPFRRWGLLNGLLFTDVYMIATGFLADREPRGSVMKWTWYGISSAAMVVIYAVLWGPLRAEAEKTSPENADLYRRNLIFLSTVWAGYPVNWLLGPEGLEVLDEDSSTAVYTGLDITSKILFGLYSLTNTEEVASGKLDRGEVPEHELRPAREVHHEVWAPGPSDGTGSERSR